MKFATKAIHAGQEPDAGAGAIMTPIYQTSTYVQDAPGKHKGYEYARSGNPTRTALQKNLAALENGKHGICFSSGVAATDAVVKLLNAGDHVISTNDLYGGTYRLFTKIYERFGLKFTFTDLTDASSLQKHITEKTKLIWIETPSNPLLNIVDIKAIVDQAKAKNILVAVDNTFATPYLQTPLELGADLVVHSATKYLGGHSDVIHGAVICKDDKLAEQLYFIQKTSGAVPGPMDCFLVLRGIKTLHVRMKAHEENGKIVANYLAAHPKISKVWWPGFESHPNHAIAKKQMCGFGGMVSFTLKNDSVEEANRVLSGCKIFALAESLGGVESLISHPASMTHASIPREERIKNGLSDSLIRLSVGIEDAEDLIEDLKSAIG